MTWSASQKLQTVLVGYRSGGDTSGCTARLGFRGSNQVEGWSGVSSIVIDANGTAWENTEATRNERAAS